MQKVGFVGLGSMGRLMAINLVKHGFPVIGFDIRENAVKAFVEAGGRGAPSVSAAAQGADALCIMVLNVQQAEEVLFAAGALEALGSQSIVVLMCTCPPGAVETLAARAVESGRRFVDAPVSGGTIGASGGTLTIMTAAPRATFEAAKPLLFAMGKNIFHVGERPGQGATIKTISQLLVGIHTAAAAEALALANKAGVADLTLLEILNSGSAASWMLNDRGPFMLEDNPAITSTVDIFVKDLGIVLEAGRESKLQLPLAAIARQLFIAAAGAGFGGSDYSQVIRAYQPPGSRKG
jgi:3-hydroxyisobutyrate dehydrogenase